jgi:endonuclease/exonuclease/phosphatase (EEP) superfamily protein YafD
LLLWSATCFVDSGNDLIAGPAALAPLVTVVALPVLAVAIGSKHPVPIAISVVAVLIPWALVVGYAASGPGSTSVGSDNTVRVVEVDGAGGRASARDIVQLSRSYDADVVVVTGLTSQLAHELTVQGLGTVLASRWVSIPAGTGAGTGLWSRLNVSNLKPLSGLSAPSVQGTISFGSASVQITVAALAGRPLLPGADWRSDLGDLAALPKSGPQFIVGGLDATPWQPAFRKLTKAGWHDAADVVGQGLRPTWPAWSPLPVAPLDHVLVRGGLGVSGTTTRKVAGTDHRALVATLILHPAPTAGD